MYNPVLFKDRADAGRRLGEELKRRAPKDPVVLAVPAGGVPGGIEIARVLKCPFDLIIVRKIQYPWTTEAGFGAVAADGTAYLGPGSREFSDDEIRVQAQKAFAQVRHREREFLKGRERPDLKDRTAILVDDGLATGSTMVAAARSVRKRGPARVIVAAPTASSGAVETLLNEADEVVVLYEHPRGMPFAVASSYEEWHDLNDEEVRAHLREWRA